MGSRNRSLCIPFELQAGLAAIPKSAAPRLRLPGENQPSAKRKSTESSGHEEDTPASKAFRSSHPAQPHEAARHAELFAELSPDELLRQRVHSLTNVVGNNPSTTHAAVRTAMPEKHRRRTLHELPARFALRGWARKVIPERLGRNTPRPARRSTPTIAPLSGK